jgi:hypothetical protein
VQPEPPLRRLDDAVLAGDGEVPEVHRARAVTADGQGLRSEREGLPCQGAGDGGEYRAQSGLSLSNATESIRTVSPPEVS